MLLLAALCYGEFSVIHSLLPPASVRLWQGLALGLGWLGLLSLVYLVWSWAHAQQVSTWYALAALVAYSLFIGLYTARADEVLLRSIPRWLVPADILVYVWTFVMLTLAHALLVLVVRFTLPEAAERGHVPFIRASFQAGILTSLTAYLVLENDAQKAALQRKQEEVLAANRNLDAQETEPPNPVGDATAVPLNGGQWLLLPLGLALGVRQLRQRHRVAG